MKKGCTLVIWVTAMLLSFGCNSYKAFFDSGKVITKEGVEEINITMINQLPFCKVLINGKEYFFLIDTGAPTIISEEIFNDLHITESRSKKMTDSQKNKQQTKFAKVPEIRIGNLVFQDIGCAVMTLNGTGLKCFGIDGIVGANLMAKLFFEFDYKHNRMKISKELSSFQVEKADFSFDFKPKAQKTPIVKGKVLDKELSFTFDTGSNGNIQIPTDYDYYKNKSSEEIFLTKNGITSIGVYGAGKSETTFVMKNTVVLDSIPFQNEIIDGGSATLIGNEFLRNYVFLIDWQANKIYFKRNEIREEKGTDGFGFSYLFMNEKAMVTSKIENRNIPLNLGDEIIAIDSLIFAEIDSLDICKYYLNKVEKDRDEIDIQVKRNNEILSFHLIKQPFIK